MMALCIKNVLILKMDMGKKLGDSSHSSDAQIIHGSILIEGENITHIGDVCLDTLSTNDTVQMIDGKGMLAMPGLINTHNHSPMSLLRGFSDDVRLMEWLEHKMWPAEARMTPEDIYWGSLLSMAEMIKSGTTTYADMYMHMDQIAEAVCISGIRASLTRGLVFLEDDGGRRLQEALDLIDQWDGKAAGRITTMLGPHAPYTCPPEPLREVVGIARKLNVPIHIHLAETTEETAQMKRKYGCTPTQFLHNAGMLDGNHHVVLAHGIHLTAQDIQLIRPNKGGIAHNPMSNLKLGCGIANIKQYIEQGITISLGTDGPGSATSLDLFKEIKIAAGLQKVKHFDPTALDAQTVLRMATIEGAKVLALEHKVGSLEVGKKADVILINMDQPHLCPHHDELALLAYSATGADVHTTIINGQVVMRDRQLLTINEEEVIHQAKKRSKRLVEGL